MEYDRNMDAYGSNSTYGPNSGWSFGDNYYFSWDPTSQSIKDGQIENGWMSATNKAEVDCLMCHLMKDSEGAGHGRAWLQSMGCNSTLPIGPANDKDCDGNNDDPSMFPSFLPTAGAFAPGDAYDTYNRNMALKWKRLDLAASMGIGALAQIDPTGGVNPNFIDLKDTLIGIDWGGAPPEINGTAIKGTPDSRNCAPCHARDDNLPGLPGMVTMKYGYGNYFMLSPPGNLYDEDTGALNTVEWIELGCKTGMGKRGAKINVPGDPYGPNGYWGMSMFNVMFNLGKNPGDPIVPETLTINAPGTPMDGDTITIKEKMPDIDVHNYAGMQCATCHYNVGSDQPDKVVELQEITRHTPLEWQEPAITYEGKVVKGIDHHFAQGDNAHDNFAQNILDGTVSCEACHIYKTHPHSATAPVPTHTGFPAFHFNKIGCTTCHIPEIYGAPGRLKYRDWTAGYWKNTWRNMLDWNYDLITGSHVPMPVVHEWITKYGQKKIYPATPGLIPMWAEYETNASDDAQLLTIVFGRDNLAVAKALQNSHNGYCDFTQNPAVCVNGPYAGDPCMSDTDCKKYDIRLSGGNMVPLFDGFALADSWEFDTASEIKAMVDLFESNDTALNQSGGHHGVFQIIFNADFDLTHGVVPDEWALGGSKRGGCVSCHSSADPWVRDATGKAIAPNPKYSPYSVGFFEGLIQPLNNALKNGPDMTSAMIGPMAVGGYDFIKNWFALFADFDCTYYCSNATVENMNNLGDANDLIHLLGQRDMKYFDPITGAPKTGTACEANSPWFQMGFDQMYGPNIEGCVQFMTETFDKVMGFPAGTAAMMGMNDGIAGLQGFVVKETVSGNTLGCNPFAGPVSSSVAQAFHVNVNNCIPDADHDPTGGALQGTCSGGVCSGGFRDGQWCAVDADCQGAFPNSAYLAPFSSVADEAAQNPMGLLYTRNDVRSHFKIQLQYTNDGTQRIAWPMNLWVEPNPDNPGHQNAWDQAQRCINPQTMQPATCNSPAQNGWPINLRVSANDYLGYTQAYLEALMDPSTAGVQKPAAWFSWEQVVESAANDGFHHDTSAERSGNNVTQTIRFDATASICPSGNCEYRWDLDGDMQPDMVVTTPVLEYTYSNPGTYNVTLTVVDLDTQLFGSVTNMTTTYMGAIPVTVEETNHQPVADFTITQATANVTATVTFTDNSADQDGDTLTGTVMWGDGTQDTVAGGGSVNHTYLKNGTYKVRYYVTDGSLESERVTKKVVVNE